MPGANRAVAGKLPAESTSFVGRRRLLAEVKAAFANTRLRIPPDPAQAYQRFCRSGPARKVGSSRAARIPDLGSVAPSGAPRTSEVPLNRDDRRARASETLAPVERSVGLAARTPSFHRTVSGPTSISLERASTWIPLSRALNSISDAGGCKDSPHTKSTKDHKGFLVSVVSFVAFV